MKKTPMTLQEKRKLKKKQEQQFTTVAFVVVALTVLAALGILIFGIVKADPFSGGFKTEQLYEFWYSEDGGSCWNFRESEEDGTDVYFFSRTENTKPYIFSSYTDFKADEKNGTITVYYGKNQSVVYSCRIKKDKLILKNGSNKMVFEKGVSLAQFNTEIQQQYPPTPAVDK